MLIYVLSLGVGKWVHLCPLESGILTLAPVIMLYLLSTAMPFVSVTSVGLWWDLWCSDSENDIVGFYFCCLIFICLSLMLQKETRNSKLIFLHLSGNCWRHTDSSIIGHPHLSIWSWMINVMKLTQMPGCMEEVVTPSNSKPGDIWNGMNTLCMYQKVHRRESTIFLASADWSMCRLPKNTH